MRTFLRCNFFLFFPF